MRAVTTLSSPTVSKSYKIIFVFSNINFVMRKEFRFPGRINSNISIINLRTRPPELYSIGFLVFRVYLETVMPPIAERSTQSLLKRCQDSKH